MSDFCASQLPAIAGRILAEQDSGRAVDPHRIQWARDVLRYFNARDIAAGQRIGIEQPEQKAAA